MCYKSCACEEHGTCINIAAFQTSLPLFQNVISAFSITLQHRCCEVEFSGRKQRCIAAVRLGVQAASSDANAPGKMAF
jgi:hypothetical protein